MLRRSRISLSIHPEELCFRSAIPLEDSRSPCRFWINSSHAVFDKVSMNFMGADPLEFHPPRGRSKSTRGDHLAMIPSPFLVVGVSYPC